MANEKIIADIIVNQAFDFMAKKANVSVSEIVAFVATNENGARYFADLVKAGLEAL